jgi:hypothetical protein
MLEGITRRTVIEMAQSLGLPLQCRALPADELRQADEVFLSTSGGGVLPVTRMDGQTLGDGRPGPITRRLVATYWAWHADPALSFGKGLSAEDEPDLWRKDLTGAIELWIEVGLPDERRGVVGRYDDADGGVHGAGFTRSKAW